MQFDTVTGSSSFHCTAFSPGRPRVSKQQNWYCICDKFKVNYGSCEKFKDYSVNVGHHNKAHLRSNDALLARSISSEDDVENIVVSFLKNSFIVAMAADRKAIETIWFIKVIEAEYISENAELDDYGHSVAKGVANIKGCFLEKVTYSANGQISKISRKVTFFYTESVLYPYVKFTESRFKWLKLYLILQNVELLIVIFLVLFCLYFHCSTLLY